MGLLFQVTMLVAQNSVEMKDIGSATATATFLRSIGGSVGVSLLGGALRATAWPPASRIASGRPTRWVTAENFPGGGPHHAGRGDRCLRHALTEGIDAVFTWAAVICVVGVVLAFFIRHVPLRGFDMPAAPAPAAVAVPDAF